MQNANPITTYEWGTLDGAAYEAAEVIVGDDGIKILYGPAGFILPHVTHRPSTRAEVEALHRLLGHALEAT